jgi:RNA polymerase sigma-70 factor (ECF subfamily)
MGSLRRWGAAPSLFPIDDAFYQRRVVMKVSFPRPPDEELLRRVAKGDAAAYATLYQCYHARLRRFLASWLHDPQKAEDLTQDVLLEVWKHAGTYRGRSRVSTWILGIARFKALTARRRQAEVLLPDAEATWVESAAPDGSPEERLLQAERARLLHRAFGELSPPQREVLQLAYGADCAGDEIARRMGCPAPTVRTRVFNAKHQLKQLLLAQGWTRDRSSRGWSPVSRPDAR